MRKHVTRAPLLLLILLWLCCNTLTLSAAQPARFLFRDQLSATEKGIYDALLQNTAQGTLDFTYRLPEPITLTSPTEAQGADASNKVMLRAYDAFYRDHPEIFWLSKKAITHSAVITLEGNGSINELVISLKPSITMANRTSMQKELDGALSAIEKQASAAVNDAQKVKLFHDAITNGCQYNEAAVKSPDAYPLSFEAHGALVSKSAVCEGYAKAFKLLCDRAGIPCIIVLGSVTGPHMWNYVSIDGVWYLVDPTYDDPIGGAPTDTYLLKGQAVAKDHKPSSSFFDGFDSKFVNPPLAAQDYVFGPEALPVTPVITGPVKQTCRVRFAPTSNGIVSVKHVGNTGVVDNGQSVIGGMTLQVNALPDPGYAVGEIAVEVGAVSYRETKNKTLRFVVTDDCTVSVSFVKHPTSRKEELP